MANKILRGSVISMIIRVYYVGLEFLTVVLLARYLGVSEFGVYAFVFALVKLLTIPTAAGLPELLVRQTAYYSLQKDFGLLKGLMIFANGIIIGLSALIILGVLAVMALIGRPVDPALFWGLCLVPVMALGFARGGVVRGFRRVVLGQLPENVIKPTLSLAIVAISWLLLDVEPTPAGAMQALFLGALGAFVFGQVSLWWAVPVEARGVPPRFELRAWTAALIPFSLISGIKVVNTQSVIVIMKFFTAASDIALLRIAEQISKSATFPLTALNTALSPHFAHAHSSGNRHEIQTVARRASQAAFAFALAMVALIFFAGEWFIEHVFGAEYLLAYYPMLILLFGQLVSSMSGSLYPMLRMVGEIDYFAKASLVSVILKVLAAISLIPFFGLYGAVLVTATAIATLNIWLAVYALRKLGINVFPWATPVH